MGLDPMRDSCTSILAFLVVTCASCPSSPPGESQVKSPPLEEEHPIVKDNELEDVDTAILFSTGFDDEYNIAPKGTMPLIPSGIRTAETASTGTPALWRLAHPGRSGSQPYAFGTRESENSGQTFNLALFEKTDFTDLDLSVAVSIISGEEDQGGGTVWRVKDEDSYYVARWNPLEDNFRIYFVKDGKRERIASVDVKADPEAWHVIRIVMKGNRIAAWLDDNHHMVVEDDTFTKSGMIGLWTKADACTLFDDVTVKAPE